MPPINQPVVVVIISASIEFNAVTGLLRPTSLWNTPAGDWFEHTLPLPQRDQSVIIFHGGWGKIAAAASTQYVIDRWQPDVIINLGTCGGFAGRISLGTTVLVERTVVYDIYEQMGDPEEAIAAFSSDIDLGWLPKNLPTAVLRTHMLSADRDLIETQLPELITKYQGSVGDWESGSIAYVATRHQVPLLILRTVSDMVGEDADSVYGDLGRFEDRTRQIMFNLLEDLPLWLTLLPV